MYREKDHEYSALWQSQSAILKWLQSSCFRYGRTTAGCSHVVFPTQAPALELIFLARQCGTLQSWQDSLHATATAHECGPHTFGQCRSTLDSSPVSLQPGKSGRLQRTRPWQPPCRSSVAHCRYRLGELSQAL